MKSMVKSFRFMLNFVWVNLGAVIGFAVIVIAGCYMTGVPDSAGVDNLFVTYYAMFPTMILLCLFLYAFALCTNNLNMALSMGARRADFFWALQGVMVFYAAVCWVLEWFLAAFPALANWEVRARWDLLSTYNGRLWTFPALCLVMLIVGCLCGLVMAKHKVLGGLLITLAVLIMMAAIVYMLLSSDTDLFDFLLETEWGWLWSGLSKVVAAVLALSAVGGELLIWRTIQRYTVR